MICFWICYIFTSKDNTWAFRKLEKKWYMMNDTAQWWMKRYIFDIGYKLDLAKTEMWEKDIKDKEATLI